MTLAELVRAGLQVSVILLVLGLGLTASPRDTLHLVRRPGLLVRSVLAMNVVMPIFVIALGLTFELMRPILLALLALAVSPVPPVLPGKTKRAGGDASYSIGLLVTASVLAIVLVPLTVWILGRVFGSDVGVAPASVALMMTMTVLGPLAVGLVIGKLAPDHAARAAKVITVAAALLLLVCLVAVLVTALPAIGALIGDGTVAAMAAFVLLGLAAGHLMGGPAEEGRTVLALCTATRHPGVAILIVTANFPGETALMPAVLLYLLVAVVLSVPYVAWRRRLAPRDAR